MLAAWCIAYSLPLSCNSRHRRQLLVHNPLTHNFQRLVERVLALLSEAQAGRRLAAASNALLLLSALLKFVAETASSTDLASLFAGSAARVPNAAVAAPAGGTSSLLEPFASALLALLASAPPSDANYVTLLAALRCLTASASTQLYAASVAPSAEAHPFLNALMCQEAMAPAAVQALLRLVIEWPSSPARAVLYAPPPSERVVTRLVRTAAATVMWLPVRTYRLLVRSSSSGTLAVPSPLGEAALAMLLVLAHYPLHPSPSPPSTTEAAAAAAAHPAGSIATAGGICEPYHSHHHHHYSSGAPRGNPFKAALQKLADAGTARSCAGASGTASPIVSIDDAEGGAAPGPSGRSSGAASGGSGVSFAALYDSFCAAPASEDRVLLLYSLLHGCR